MKIETDTGHVILLNDEDWPLIADHVWRVAKGSQRQKYVLYAMAAVPRNDGSLCGRGYPRHTTIRMHRLIMRAGPGEQIDHKDGNGLNNQRANLRFATPAGNSVNRSGWARTGYKGVGDQCGKFQAHIRHNDKKIHLGTFRTAEEAALAYNVKAVELFGEFARLNEVSN